MATGLEGLSPEAIEAIASLAVGLDNDPNTRTAFRRLAKAKFPNVHAPEIDMANAVDARLKERDEKIAALERQQAERDARDRIEAQRKAVLSVDGITESDIPAIEKLMVDDQIPNYTTAAKYLAVQRKSAQPTSSLAAPSMFGAPRGAILPEAEIFKDPDGYATSTAKQLIDQFRGRARASA